MPNDTSVKVELIRDLGAVDPTAFGEQPLLFDRLEWFARTWTHCPPGEQPLIAHATTEGASMWLMLAEGGPRGTVGLASWYTLAFRPILNGNPARAGTLLTGIAAKLRTTADRVTLEHVPADAAASITRAFASASWFGIRTPNVAHWTVDVAGLTFAEYWAQRPGQLRSTIKRKTAKAALDVAIRERFDPVAWDDYAAVYRDSWKPEEGSLPFLRDMAAHEGARGTLRFGIASKGGVAIAAQLWTVERGTAIIHKLAHRTGSDAFSPGTILSRAMFEHAIDRDKVSLIDFGTGDDRYKADWMTTRTMLERVELFNLASPRGLAGAARAGAGLLVARLRRR